MTQLEKTIKRIQALVPDVMELKFGCEVRQVRYRGKDIEPTEPWYLSDNDTQRCYIEGKYLCFEVNSGEFQDEKYPLHNYEILGSPITLAVVLRTLSSERRNYIDVRDTIYQLVMMWNLAKDDLRLQSKECQEFIDSLIGV